MQFERFIKLVGRQNFDKIRNLKILVVGVGGVGGHVVEALVRCGVETMTLVDDDKVDITNLNRQIIASFTTMGRKKVDCLEERIHEIHPDCNVTTMPIKVNRENIKDIFIYRPDFIVDACDDLIAKKALLKYAVEHEIPLIVALGVGKRLDPSKLAITTLDKTSYDPIAKVLRKYVKEEGIKQKITVLASKEVPLSIKDTEIPSCSFVPATAGLLIASHIVRSTLM